MSEERWVSLTPEEFDQLQKYSEYSSKKIKDVLAEFNEGGSLKQYDPHESTFVHFSIPSAQKNIWLIADTEEIFVE